jgi:5-methyltetrahydropteroyltriglutamate--homocysteine methyltransferase
VPNNQPLNQLRVDNVGSFLRPAELISAFESHAAGQLSDEALREAQDAAIPAVIAQQEAHGLPVITDGEYRRRNFNDSFADVSGFADGGLSAVVPSRPDAGTAAPGAAGQEHVSTVYRAVSARLELVRNRPLLEYEYAQALTERPVKATIVNPDGLAQRHDEAGTPDEVYPDTDAFLEDVVAVGREIIRGLVAAGCQYIQIDGPRYSAYLDPDARAELEAHGVDLQRALQRAVDAENALIDGFPDTTFGLHVCRGNRRSQSHFTGPYDAIAEQLGQLRHQRLLLEYDSELAGGFEPLRFVRPDTVVVLGLITTKTGTLESADDLRRRIDEATKHLPIEQLALSTQCGFASALEGNLLTVDDQWRKIDLLMEVASEVWGTQSVAYDAEPTTA